MLPSTSFITGHDVCVQIHGQTLTLLPEKAIYWAEARNLLLADIHLGKASHFRKAGIAIPATVSDRMLEELSALVERTKPAIITIVGDLFHSHMNKEWELFSQWRNQYPHIQVELVRGNHDIMHAIAYKNAGIKVYPVCLLREPFLFCHEPVEMPDERFYTFSGHLHPGAYMAGPGRQRLTLPCFFFGKYQAYLPAYGKFTGLARLSPGKEDKVYVVADAEVFPVGK